MLVLAIALCGACHSMSAYVPRDGHEPTLAEFKEVVEACRHEAISRAFWGPFGIPKRREVYRECMYRRGWEEGEPTFREAPKEPIRLRQTLGPSAWGAGA